jgi:hypothetical protein
VPGEAASDEVHGAVHGYLDALSALSPSGLPEATRHEWEQRRAATQAREPRVPGMLPHARRHYARDDRRVLALYGYA